MPFLRRQRFFFFPSASWTSFSLFLISNSFLSHGSLDWKSKLLLGFTGLLFPFLILLFKPYHPLPGPEGCQEKEIPPLSLFFWILLLLAAGYLRFHDLTTLCTWPFVDEGRFGYFSLCLSEKWRWNLFFDQTQIPPFYYWGLGLFFKVFGPSLQNLWLFPAILSLSAIPLVYFASRLFFPSSRSVCVTLFWALSYWPLFTGRQSSFLSLLLLWQLLAFYVLGLYLRQEQRGSHKAQALILGLVLGAGFYVSVHWVFMAAWTTLVVGFHQFRKPVKSLLPVIYFGGPLLLLPLPILVAFLTGDHGSYLQSLSVFSNDFQWSKQVHIWWKYMSTPIWGDPNERLGYNPIWGGYLNPVAGAFFLFGLAETFRNFKQPKNLGLLSGFAFFALPGLMTCQYEPFRLLLILPVLASITGLGIWKLFTESDKATSRLFCVLLLVTSIALDIYHLDGPYQHLWRTDWKAAHISSKLLERWKAFEILSSIERKSGPGLIFTEFDQTLIDQTLTTALYPFNASRNPSLSPDQARWASLLTNINYAPFLNKRFPDSKWFPLSSDQDPSHATLVLGIIPVEPENKKTFLHWLEIERSLRPETFEWLQIPLNRTSPHLSQWLYPILSMTEKDPFLESCLGERLFYAEMTNAHWNDVFKVLQRAITLGYPSANLYNDLGVYWFAMGNPDKAREAFQAARRSPLHYIGSPYNPQVTTHP